MLAMFARSPATLTPAPEPPDDPALDTPPAASRINAEGLYGPASQAWRLNREATLLLGAGPRALLMQIAHPLVAQGVADHSNFQADPWRRLRATLRSYLTIVYGTSADARAEIHRLNQFHRAVSRRQLCGSRSRAVPVGPRHLDRRHARPE